MALVSHTIYSHYDPRNHLEEFIQLQVDSGVGSSEGSVDALDAKGQLLDAERQIRERERQLEEIERAWRTENAFPPSAVSMAPKFVRASGVAVEKKMWKGKEKAREDAGDVSGWYSSLTSRARTPSTATVVSSSRFSKNTTGSSIAVSMSPKRKRNWFESTLPPGSLGPLALPSYTQPFSSTQSTSTPTQTSSTQPTHPPPPAPPSLAPSLAEMLHRSPPPLPTEPAFKPPIFLELNPTNRGWKMLERWGWREGEGVGGVGSTQHRPRVDGERERKLGKGKGRDEEQSRETGKEVIDLTQDEETIDLTLSDDEDPIPIDIDAESYSDDASSVTLDDDYIDVDALDDLDEHFVFASPESVFTAPDVLSMASSLSAAGLRNTHRHTHDYRTTLLTPIPTIMKSDRLGIGLRAKTRKVSLLEHTLGSRSHRSSHSSSRHLNSSHHPKSHSHTHSRTDEATSSYRAPIRTLTPNFVRHLEGMEVARKRRERVGRGWRGYKRDGEREGRERREMIGYLNE